MTDKLPLTPYEPLSKTHDAKIESCKEAAAAILAVNEHALYCFMEKFAKSLTDREAMQTVYQGVVAKLLADKEFTDLVYIRTIYTRALEGM